MEARLHLKLLSVQVWCRLVLLVLVNFFQTSSLEASEVQQLWHVHIWLLSDTLMNANSKRSLEQHPLSQ